MGVFHPLSCIMYLSVAIERFCSITFPFWHRVHITVRTCRYWVTLASLSWTITQASLFTMDKTIETNNQLDITHIVFLWITFLLTQSVYIASYISIKKQNSNLRTRQDMNETTMKTIKLRLKNENNFLVTIAIACLILGITTLPFLIIRFFWFVVASGEDSKTTNSHPSFFMWSVVGIGVNSVVNVFIYLWRLPKYRKTFKKIYCEW